MKPKSKCQTQPKFQQTCVQPNPGRFVLEGKGEALDGGGEGESHHHKDRPGVQLHGGPLVDHWWTIGGQSDGGESPPVMII